MFLQVARYLAETEARRNEKDGSKFQKRFGAGQAAGVPRSL